MKNFIAVGDRLTFTAPADIASGEGVLVGTLFGVAEAADSPTARGRAQARPASSTCRRRRARPGPSGAKIYWDDTAKRCTTVATGNTLIGVAVRAVGDTAARNRRSGAARTPASASRCLIRRPPSPPPLDAALRRSEPQRRGALPAPAAATRPGSASGWSGRARTASPASARAASSPTRCTSRSASPRRPTLARRRHARDRRRDFFEIIGEPLPRRERLLWTAEARAL